MRIFVPNERALLQELKNSLHGLEMEGVRIDESGHLAQTPHPKGLDPKEITRDYSETQLEFITPPLKKTEDAISYLMKLKKKVDGEKIWQYSAPGPLPEEIPVADFGPSKEGRRKTLYRKGLGLRYGPKMQMLSGVHYNFSFSGPFWEILYDMSQETKTEDCFRSECYLKIVRNFLRFGWICTYLFGVTPAVDKTFIDHPRKPLRKWGKRTYVAPLATSIRMSTFGYQNKIECQKPVSFNSLDEYVQDLGVRISTPHPEFSLFNGDQINGNIFQSESEHYSRIRPKPSLKEGESHLDALKKKGISYLEIRNMDISPFSESGIEISELHFLQVFLLFCLFCEDKKFTPKERLEICKIQNKVALYGRDPHLILGERKTLRESACDLIKLIQPFAKIWGKEHEMSLALQRQKILHPELTPSGRLLQEMGKGDLVGYILKRGC